MTPRGSSTISDAVDLGLQILPTERENITTLLCTKSRRTGNVIRKGWRRDFFYDPDSLLITPLHEVDESKEYLTQRLVELQEKLNLSNVALAKELNISEHTYRRYATRETLIPDSRIPLFEDTLNRLYASLKQGDDEFLTISATSAREDPRKSATSDSPPIYKEIKNIDGVVVIGNKNIVSNHKIRNVAKVVETYKDGKRKAKKTSTSRPKISLDDPCFSCPANKEKSSRFVDGEVLIT
jgi:hypothetical protein